MMRNSFLKILFPADNKSHSNTGTTFMICIICPNPIPGLRFFSALAMLYFHIFVIIFHKELLKKSKCGAIL